MRSSSLQSYLYARIDSQPEKKALAFLNSQGKFYWMTFAQVHERANACAVALAKNGLNRQQVCLIVLPHSQMTAEILLGTIYLGAVPLLIAPPLIQGQSAYSSLMQTLKRIIRKTRPTLVVLPKTMQNMWALTTKGSRSNNFIVADDLKLDENETTVARISPSGLELAAFQLTSGTTGAPKICVWQHRQVVAALDTMAEGLNLTSADVCLNWVPLYHDMGLVNNFLTCLVKGVPLAMMDPMDFVKKPALWLRGLFDTGATLTWSPNFGFALAASRVKDNEMEGVRLDHVKAFWNAAERIHLDTIYSFYHRFSSYGVTLKSLRTNFGCTENVGGATFTDPEGIFKVEQIDEKILQEKQTAHVVTEASVNQSVVSVVGAGVPCGGIKVLILSKKGKVLPEGHLGEVVLHSPSRMAGYLSDAKATQRAFEGNLLRTGDLGYLRGRELFWVGRVKERITVRGKKLDPSDFERVLFGIDTLRPGCFVVFGVDDAGIGTQKVVVITEIRDNLSVQAQSLIQMIRSEIFQTLGVSVDKVYLTPKGTLAKTSSGKRRHRHFRKLYLENKLESVLQGGSLEPVT